MEFLLMQFLQRFQQWPIVLRQQLPRDVDPKIGIDADQMSVERRMMNLRERNAVRNDRLAELLILVRDDVRGVEQLFSGNPDSAQRPL